MSHPTIHDVYRFAFFLGTASPGRLITRKGISSPRILESQCSLAFLLFNVIQKFENSGDCRMYPLKMPIVGFDQPGVPHSRKFLLFEHNPCRTEWEEGHLAANNAHLISPQTCKEIYHVLGSVLDSGTRTKRGTLGSECSAPSNEDSPLEDFYTFSCSVSFSFLILITPPSGIARARFTSPILH